MSSSAFQKDTIIIDGDKYSVNTSIMCATEIEIFLNISYLKFMFAKLHSVILIGVVIRWYTAQPCLHSHPASLYHLPSLVTVYENVMKTHN